MKKVKRWLSLLAATAVVLAFLIVAQAVLVPKYISASPEGSLTAEYYADVAEVTHDVLFVGDCEVYETFIPAVLWEEFGVSSYVRGSPQQLTWQSYYLLEDALRYETPKVVVFNVLALKYGEPQKEAYNRMTIDGMEWSSSKVDCIDVSMTEGESFLSYVFPLLRFHSRWSELTAEDWTYAFTETPTVSDSGYLLQTDVVPPNESASGLEGSPLADYTLPEGSMAYLDRMVDLCREKGITLVLVKAPINSWRYWWYDEWDEQVRDYANEHGLDYYNLLENEADIGIDWQTDSYDGGIHLNVYGAAKTTTYFGSVLVEKYGLSDRRQTDEAAVRVWNQRVATFNDKWKQNEEE